MSKKYLTREQILEADDIRTIELDVPEWLGGTLVLRELSGEERDLFESSTIEQRGKNVHVNLHNARARLAALSIIDPETGKKMFSQADVAKLAKKSGSALQRVFDAAMDLSKISADDLEELTEEIKENPFEDSPSA